MSKEDVREPMLLRHSLLLFFVLAFTISWLLWAPLWMPALGVTGLPVLPFNHALGAAGPITAAFLMTALESGRPGVTDLMTRLVLIGGRMLWPAVALVAPFALLALALSIEQILTGKPGGSDGVLLSREFPQFSALGFLLYDLVSFGYGEETGWRGYALPRLQERYSALVATVILTAGWALWHLPLFLYRPGYIGMDAFGVTGWFFSLLTGALLLTWLFNESGGSLLVVALFHAAIDVAFTSGSTSSFVAATIGGAITIWGVAVLMMYGSEHLSKRGKMVKHRKSPTLDLVKRSRR